METEEEQDEKAWDELLASPHGQQILVYLLAEAHQQIANGEVEDSGFGLE